MSSYVASGWGSIVESGSGRPRATVVMHGARFAGAERLVVEMLRCEECGAAGLLVLQVRDVEDIDPPFTIVYCRMCAEREFGSTEGALRDSTRGVVEAGGCRPERR